MNNKRTFNFFKSKGNENSNKNLSRSNSVDFKSNNQDKILSKSILSLTLEQKMNYTDEQIVELQKKLESLPPLRVGEVNIYPIEAGKLDNGGYYANVFIRNAGDLLLDLSLNAITLCLNDSKGEKVAGGVFQIENFQSIKFGEARYWTFGWRPEEVLKQDADLTSYSITFS